MVRDWKWEAGRGQEPESRSQDRLSTHYISICSITATLAVLGVNPIYR